MSMKVWYCENFLSCLDLVKMVGDNVGRWFGGRVNRFTDLNKSVSLRHFLPRANEGHPNSVSIELMLSCVVLLHGLWRRKHAALCCQ